MPKPTKFKFKDFIRTIWFCGNTRFGRCEIVPKRGSARRIELFKKENDQVPFDMFTVHEDKYVWSGDFKKAYTHLGITKQEFIKEIEKK